MKSQAEIMDAMERCATGSPEPCLDCPYGKKHDCSGSLLKDALALMRELMAGTGKADG